MDALLSERSRQFRDGAREVAETVTRPAAAEIDRTGEYPWATVEAMKAKGLWGIWIPQEYGGPGAGYLDLGLVIEELARACGGTGAGARVGLPPMGMEERW